MTLRECHVDRQFPYHVIRCWVRTRPPPPSIGFLRLTLRHRNAVTRGSEISTPGSHSSTSTSTSPWSLEKAFFLFNCDAFYLAGCLFPFCASAKSYLSAVFFFSKYVVESSPLFGPLPPPSGCLACCSLEWQPDSPLALSCETFGLH